MQDEVLTLLKTKTPTLSSGGGISLPPEVWDLLQATQKNTDRQEDFCAQRDIHKETSC